jgi:hypothetical protein
MSCRDKKCRAPEENLTNISNLNEEVWPHPPPHCLFCQAIYLKLLKFKDYQHLKNIPLKVRNLKTQLLMKPYVRKDMSQLRQFYYRKSIYKRHHNENFRQNRSKMPSFGSDLLTVFVLNELASNKFYSYRCGSMILTTGSINSPS